LLRDGDPLLLREVTEVAATFARTVDAGRVEEAWRGFIDHYNGAGSWRALPDATRERMLRMSDAAVRACAALLTNPITVSDLTRIRVPTLAIRGAQTTAPERRLCELVADRAPEARQVVVEGAGHMLPLTHPAAMAEALEAHLRALEPHPS
jgi:pimeloyl-ACP methyl ester carboxylesterase